MEENNQTLKFICPNCGKNLDCHIDADPKFTRKPQDGDMSVCLYCAAYLLFKGKGKKITLNLISLKDVPEKYHRPLEQARALTMDKGFCT